MTMTMLAMLLTVKRRSQEESEGDIALQIVVLDNGAYVRVTVEEN
jgi:hypothetical protein